MKAQHPWWVTSLNFVATLMGLFLIIVGIIVLNLYVNIHRAYATGVFLPIGCFFLFSGILMINALWSKSQLLFSVAIHLLGIVMGVVAQLGLVVFAVTDPNIPRGQFLVYMLIGTAVGLAALLKLLIPTLITVRRNIRWRQGLCIRCGYDLRGVDHEACPECGEEIRKGNPA